VHENQEQAARRVAEFAQNERLRDFKAEVYAPYGAELPGYSVVIGANLTYEQAEELRQKAIKVGFPENTRLWTFPQKR
jgi:hypothetical protein